MMCKKWEIGQTLKKNEIMTESLTLDLNELKSIIIMNPADMIAFFQADESSADALLPPAHSYADTMM